MSRRIRSQSRRTRSKSRPRRAAPPATANAAGGAGDCLADELQQVLLVGLSPSIAAHLMEPLRSVARGARLKMTRRADLGSPSSFPPGTLLVLQDSRGEESGLEILRELRSEGVSTPAILIVTGDDVECPADVDELGDLDVIPLSECSRFAFRRSLILLGSRAARERLADESGGRMRAYERVLAAKDEERLRVLEVATALERRLSAAEEELQQTEAAWAARLARADDYIARLERQLADREEAGKRSATESAEEARRQRQRALELAFHRDERMQMERTIAELRRIAAERENELEEAKAERSQAGDLAARLADSERVRSAQTRTLLACQRRIVELEQHLGTIATLLETEQGKAGVDPAALLEEVAKRLVQAESVRSQQQGAIEQLSHSLAVQQVDDTLDNAQSRLNVVRRVDEAVQRARRLGLPLICLMIGIDDQLALRRRYGSVAFDFLLVRIAQRLQMTLRDRDVVMRYGDDGDFLLLTDAKTTAAARSHAQRLIREVCAEPLDLGKRRVEIGLSIAVTPYHEDMKGAPDLVRRARHGLFQAQSRGERQVLVYEGEAPSTQPGAEAGEASGERSVS